MEYQFKMRDASPEDALFISNIARQIFPEDLILDVKEIRGWMNNDQPRFRVAVIDNPGDEADGRVVGYYAILPMVEGIYEALKRQEITELDIQERHIMDLYGDKAEALYVLDLAKIEEFPVGALMIRDMNSFISQAMSQNKAIQKAGTWAFTQKGQKIAEAFKFQKVLDVKNYEGTYFYEIERKKFLNIDL